MMPALLRAAVKFDVRHAFCTCSTAAARRPTQTVTVKQAFKQKASFFQKKNSVINKRDVTALQSALDRAKTTSHDSDSDSDGAIDAVDAANVWVNSKPSHYYPETSPPAYMAAEGNSEGRADTRVTFSERGVPLQ